MKTGSAVIASLASMAAAFLQIPMNADNLSGAATEATKAAKHPTLPNKILWAWKRSEDLSKINPSEFGVAYLACHVFIQGENIKWQSRNQPLKVPPNTIVVPTIRIDVDRGEKPAFSEKQIEKIVQLIERSNTVPNLAQVQIDYDALESERPFYNSLLKRLRKTLPESIPISITALASWCLFDNWIKDLPIDESVPMMFSLGKDRDKVLRYFRQGRDFIDPRARQSLGLSLEDTPVNELMIPIVQKRKIPVRVYVFTRMAWTEKKIQTARTMLNQL